MATTDEDAEGLDGLLTVSEAAEVLGVSARAVWRLVEQGELARVVLGTRTTRFQRSDLDALIAARRVVK